MLEFDSNLDLLNAQLSKVNSKLTEFDKKANQSFSGFEDNVGKSTKSLNSFNVSLAAVAVSAALLTSRITKLTDEFALISRQIRRSEETQEGFNRRFDELFDLSNDVGQSLKDTVSLYARLEFATRDLNLTQGQTLQITETLTKAFKSTGLTAQESASATIQLSQAFASGRLQGDEFRSVAENAPVVLQALSKELNVNVGALKEMAAQGLITSDVLSTAVLNSAKEIDEEFNRVTKGTKTLDESLAVVNNGFLKLVGTIDDLTGASSRASSALVDLGETMSNLSDTISDSDGAAFWMESVVLFLKTQGVEARAAASLIEQYIGKVKDAKSANEGLSFQAPGSPAVNLFGQPTGETPLPGEPVLSDTPFADVGEVNERATLDPLGFDYEQSLNAFASFEQTFLENKASLDQSIIDANRKKIEAIGEQEKAEEERKKELAEKRANREKELAEKRVELEEKAAERRKAIEKRTAKAIQVMTVSAYGNMFNSLSQVAEEGSKQQEAFAKASIVASTAAGIMRQFADFPYPIAIPNSIAIGLSGAAQLASVGSGSTASGATSGGSAALVAPSGGGPTASGATSGAVSGTSTGLTTNNTTSGFDVSDQQITASINDVSGGGISTQRIIISTEDGQDLLDGISVGVQESQFNGRT